MAWVGKDLKDHVAGPVVGPFTITELLRIVSGGTCPVAN